MAHFLSCDWGTSSFRLRLVDMKTCKVLAEEKSGCGIADTFNLWQEQVNRDPAGKLSFYLDVIRHHINKIETKINQPLKGTKLLVSGMAASTIGFIEIPYSAAPIPVDGSGLKTAFIPSNENFEHDILLVSGVKTEDDVMRGEETQLIGCADASRIVENELFIFPGTHSKHIQVKNNQVVGIKTYMTGDFFELLSQKSILRDSVEVSENMDLKSFISGVRDSRLNNLLHGAFKVRTNQLFDVFTKQENFSYLSGLLIGTELNDLHSTEADTINLLCGSNLKLFYEAAMQELGTSKTINKFDADWVDEAVVRGHYKIGKQIKILI